MIYRFVAPDGSQFVIELPGFGMPPFRGKWNKELAAACGMLRAKKELGKEWMLLVPGTDAQGRKGVVEVPAADGQLLDKVPEPPTVGFV